MATFVLLEIVIASMTTAIACFGAALVLRNDAAAGRTAGLAIFLLISGLDALDSVFLASGVYRTAPHLIGVVWPWPILLGPAIYAYASDMTAEKRAASSPHRTLVLFSPAILSLLCTAPFYVLPAEAKIAAVEGNVTAFSQLEFFMHAFVPVLYALFFAVTLFFLVALFRLLARHVRRMQDLFANIEDKSLSWLRWALFILIAAWAWAGILYWWSLSNSAPPWQGAAQAALQLFWIAAFGYFGARQAPVFAKARLAADGGVEADSDEPARKYARSALTEQRMDQIAAKLNEALSLEDVYADPALSLRSLSDRLRVSENYLSQTLNLKLNTNFFDFVNSRRIEAAKVRLWETDDTILSIALEVGFNSRSTFNAAFKKHAGQAPSEFRAARSGRPGDFAANSEVALARS